MATQEKVVLKILVVQGAVTLCEMKVKLYHITGDGLKVVQQTKSGCLTVVLSRIWDADDHRQFRHSIVIG